MFEDFKPARVPVTRERALAVLRDAHRQQCEFDPEADPDVELSFDTTVKQWREACDLLAWRQVAEAYNRWWAIDCSLDEWRAALEPAKVRTLGDVCDLLARHAQVPHARPMVLLGFPCLSGGTFLTIRSMLHEAGADTQNIAPSTLLEPYARHFLSVFLGPISWLAPGALPPLKVHHPIYHSAIWGILAGMISLVIGVCASLHWLTIIGAALLAASYAMSWAATRILGPIRVEFGDLKTFRDLSNRIADHIRGPSSDGLRVVESAD